MTKRKTLAKLADLAGKAGRWLGPAPPARHNGAVEADRFDGMTWRDVMGHAAAVRQLIEDLGERHDVAACPTADMAPSRLVNRQVIARLLESPRVRRVAPGDRRRPVRQCDGRADTGRGDAPD